MRIRRSLVLAAVAALPVTARAQRFVDPALEALRAGVAARVERLAAQPDRPARHAADRLRSVAGLLARMGDGDHARDATLLGRADGPLAK
ncbi:MAG TPA: hypothetical protein VKA21_02230, partial [Candidatus Binatia bacterium]|nr:hypothetical protein [Candidatus Binatia bacterium]